MQRDLTLRKKKSKLEQLEELKEQREALFAAGFHHRVITIDMQIARLEREITGPKKGFFE
jgi:hypothetical protein